MSGEPGSWRKLGPLDVTVEDGALEITCRVGDEHWNLEMDEGLLQQLDQLGYLGPESPMSAEGRDWLERLFEEERDPDAPADVGPPRARDG